MELLVIGILWGVLITLVAVVVVWFWPARTDKPPGVPPAPIPREPEDEQARREREAFSRDWNKMLSYAAKPPGGKRRE